MSEKNLKLCCWIVIIVSVIVLIPLFFGNGGKTNVNIQNLNSAADGLNLKAVGELATKCPDVEDFEKRLNSKSEGVNNLDLNEDGKVDYIKVTEYGSGEMRGLSLTVDVAAEDEQEIATIEIEKEANNQAQVQTHGNSQIYGHNHYYRSHFGFTDYLLLSYMFSPHSYYHSPWGYGRYPGSYSSYGTQSRSSYTRTVSQKTANSKFQGSNANSLKSSAKSPNAGKAAKSIKAPLKNPTTSQKSFQSRNPSKTIRSGGFGSSKPSVRSSSFSRSGGSFGGK